MSGDLGIEQAQEQAAAKFLRGEPDVRQFSILRVSVRARGYSHLGTETLVGIAVLVLLPAGEVRVGVCAALRGGNDDIRKSLQRLIGEGGKRDVVLVWVVHKPDLSLAGRGVSQPINQSFSDRPRRPSKPLLTSHRERTLGPLRH